MMFIHGCFSFRISLRHLYDWWADGKRPYPFARGGMIKLYQASIGTLQALLACAYMFMTAGSESSNSVDVLDVQRRVVSGLSVQPVVL
eukprot:1342772-Amorphochlora_amoeboformis.AAC.1